MLGSNPNILRSPGSSLLPEGGITITIKPGDLLPPPPEPGLTVAPEGDQLDTEQSFHDALALALAGGRRPPEHAAFWEWLERTVSQNLDAFKDDELPYSLLTWAKRL